MKETTSTFRLVVQLVDSEVEVTRPWQTTEFWVMVTSVAITALGWLDFPIQAWGAIIAWILGRVILKTVAAKKS